MDLTPPAAKLNRLVDSKKPPHRIQKVLQYLKLRMQGMVAVESPWLSYRLQNHEFDALQWWLKKDEALWSFVECKVRYDYDSVRARLVSRSPTPLHTTFMALLAQEITARLYEISTTASDPVTRTFAAQISGRGSARIDLLGTEEVAGAAKKRRDPDYSFQHRFARWPGVVFELSCGAKRRSLPRLAADYLLETNEEIRMLVGIDLDTVTERATISTWEPHSVRDKRGVVVELEAALVRDGETFRNMHGNANPDPTAGLHLDLEDFAPPHLTADLTDDVSIFVNSRMLCALLRKAEKAQLRADELYNMRSQYRLGKRKREEAGEAESEKEASGVKMATGEDGAIEGKPMAEESRVSMDANMSSDSEVMALETTKCHNTASGERSPVEGSVFSNDEQVGNADAPAGDGTIDGEESVSRITLTLRTPSPERKDSQDGA